MQTTDRLSYLALPMMAAAAALVVGSPLLWWRAPLGAVIAAGFALVVGIPVLWVLRQISADRTWVLAGVGGVLGGVSWWLAARGASTFEVLLPAVIGAATGAMFGVVQAGTQTSSGAVRTRVVAVLMASVLVVVSALIWLPARWPQMEQKITTRASWTMGTAVDARGVKEVVIQVADPPCRVSLFLPELEPFLLAQPLREVEVVLSRSRRFTSEQKLVVKSIGSVNVPYPTTQGVNCS